MTDRLSHEACRFIETCKDKPFFLYLAHYAVHTPIQGKKDLAQRYREKLAKMPPSDGPRTIQEGGVTANQTSVAANMIHLA